MARRVASGALVLLGYALVSFLYFGRPIADHPGRYLIGYSRDPQIFVWSFAWFLHALETWQNPFVSHAIYAPDGVNLVWITSVPGLGILFTPITALFGPGVAYNFASILAPALSAFTAYLLCRHVTRSLWASLVGGYLFGFSSYMLGQLQGHLHMVAAFLLPLMALAVVRYLRTEIGSRGLAWRLGVLFGLQFWLSTEMLASAALALVVGLVLAYALVPATRERLRRAWRPLVEAAGVGIVMAAPLVLYAVKGFRSESINDPHLFDADVVNFVVPTKFVWAGGSTFEHVSNGFRGGIAESGAYLGIPTLVILAWYALSARRSRVARFLVAAILLAAFVALGTGLAVKGRIEAWLPWRLLASQPLFDNILPTRFSAYMALGAAVAVALWTAARRDWLQWALPALAVAALVPDLAHDWYKVVPERWAFFTAGTYKLCIPKNENVAIFPFGWRDNSTLWQAETGFWFRIPEGYLAPRPPKTNIDSDPVIRMLTDTDAQPTLPEMIAFIKNKKVDRILTVAVYPQPSPTEMHRFGPLQGSGGVLISPACGYPSMQEGIHPTPPHPKG
jgi:dolichyl-phosphate beta-glucosyltransferase